MKPSLFTLILALISYSCISQTINGTISDLYTQEPISGAHIYLKKFDKVVVSNEEGNFQLIATSEIELNDSFIISHISYQTQKITFSKLKEHNYRITMEPTKKELREVEIKADKVYKSYIKYEKVTNLNSRQYAFGSTKTGNKIIVIGGDESAFQVEQIINLKN
ncbi:MAG: carboxypeptidase-like regulatory domain-containing protein [Chloroflexia bacterium]|nr:carboxypeptidase-like regulatory domain-containing protein [Chloroflexia bacterium]